MKQELRSPLTDSMMILIIEDERKVASFLKQGLEEHGYTVEVAYNATDGLVLFQNKTFNAIILDVNLPDAKGFDVCREIRRSNQNVPVLMLTAMGATDDKINGFEAGADDYLVKPFEFVELIMRLKALLKRASNGSGSLAKIFKAADLELDIDAKRVRRSGQEISLTAKEFALLEFMIRNKGRVLSKAEIASKVWDIHFDTGTNVIEVYVNFLRKKIDKDFDQKLIQTKVGMGYVLKDD